MGDLKGKEKGKVFDLICKFNVKKTYYDKVQKEFNLEKKAFYAIMDGLEFDENDELKIAKSSDAKALTARVKKVQTVNMKFDVDKLKGVLDKEEVKRNEVIDKVFKIRRPEVLLRYFKGKDLDLLKSCVEIEESVDEEKLNNLVKTGKLNSDKIKECCNAEVKSRYYRVTVKRDLAK